MSPRHVDESAAQSAGATAAVSARSHLVRRGAVHTRNWHVQQSQVDRELRSVMYGVTDAVLTQEQRARGVEEYLVTHAQAPVLLQCGRVHGCDDAAHLRSVTVKERE